MESQYGVHEESIQSQWKSHQRVHISANIGVNSAVRKKMESGESESRCRHSERQQGNADFNTESMQTIQSPSRDSTETVDGVLPHDTSQHADWSASPVHPALSRPSVCVFFSLGFPRGIPESRAVTDSGPSRSRSRLASKHRCDRIQP
jgi:hypothetical protein